MIHTLRLGYHASLLLILISVLAIDLIGGDAPVQVAQPEKANSKPSVKKVGPFDQLAI